MLRRKNNDIAARENLIAVQSAHLQSLWTHVASLELAHDEAESKLVIAEARLDNMEGRLQDALRENERLTCQIPKSSVRRGGRVK